ncbi:HNH endonuclease [Mycobacterium sp. PSTR-4-N]|uniref:HNH endonuclease n=1 Tax=Mycobacterium sp. PSTR-4-N TaxID=2917745 RepID=UPI001F14A78D|nr:HNH endonuclease [Mycobacterium sp. PSTR-4-N]MCG7596313.1 HNH endonuclease [Mycobacterium sp. PSTR-4-N]
MRGKDMDAPVRLRGSDPARFWQKVNKTESCWEWTAYKNSAGYGKFRLDGESRLAHRVSFEWANGPIPEGMEIDHICHNPGCVNPAHLRLATGSLNKQNLAGARANSASGIRGVEFHAPTGKWRARAKLNGKQVRLGSFSSSAEAEAAVIAWRRVNMPYSVMDQKGAVPC